MDASTYIPTFVELHRLAPTVSLVLAVAGIGFAVGRWSTRAHIETLREWIADLKRKN